MNIIDVVFGKDIILDEEAFDKAVSDFDGLSQKLQNLRNEIEEMMAGLKEGFDTPAGRKFIKACETNLYKPMDDQKLVLDHIASSLKQSKQKYESVFDSYEKLTNTINNA
ncbi:MAG: hypothetical protein E7573_11610 [Ruminococcaceae bacterium]|nr:hypothetical protein [Oscillospiraceae bacterium]MBR3595925.1 WXG100 family type VII secretion target [Clostridia bacterium]